MITFFRNLYRYRELLQALSTSYIKARYKQTILGVGWALVQPLVLMFTVLAIAPFLGQTSPLTEPYPLFIFIGFWIWTFFANSLSFAIPNLVQNTSLLRKVYFPREILIVAAIVPSLLDFALGTIMLICFMIYFGVALTPWLLLLPLLFAICILFTLGIALIGSIANVGFRDIGKFLPIGLQILFFTSPVMYLFTTTETLAAKLYHLNPLTGVIDGFRSIIMHGTIDTYYALLYPLILSVGIFYCGYKVFKKGEQLIADII